MLTGKRFLVTGVLDPRSIGFTVAQRAEELGAELLLTSFGRARSLTERSAARLATNPDVLELDVTRVGDFERLTKELDARWGSVDGVVHSIAFAPPSCLGEDFLAAPWDDVATTMQVSTYSLAALARATLPLLRAAGGGSIVGLDFDASVAWPSYNWMGVAKAGLESTSRYLARGLASDGVRVNLVAAGPLRTMAARSIDGFDGFEEVWSRHAPLGWNVADTQPVADAVCWLLGAASRSTTGEILHVDGGMHAVGA